MAKGQLGKHTEFLRGYFAKYPTMSKAGLARLIYKEHPERFTNAELVRTLIRSNKGQAGKEKLKNYSEAYFEPSALAKKYGIPTAIPEPFENYILDAEMLLIVNDIHLPFHDERALTAALEYGKKQGCDSILLNGDIMDCHSVSHFRKTAPPALRFKDELEMAKGFLKGLTRNFKRVYYKEGNHEERLSAYLQQKAEELYDLDAFQLPVLLDLHNMGIRWIDDKRIIKYDHLSIIHGHEYAKGFIASVNAARGLFLKSKGITLQGHCHTSSEHTETTIDDKVITCWSVGCLSNLHPRWNRLNKWNHGCCVAHKDFKGRFLVDNRRIINGDVV
jgi:predicted phosphodiesterase